MPHRILVETPGTGWLTVQAPQDWGLLEVFIGYPETQLPDDVKAAIGTGGHRIVEIGTPADGTVYFQLDAGTGAGFVRYGTEETLLSDDMPFPTSEFSFTLGPERQARFRVSTTVTPVSLLLMDHVPQGLEPYTDMRHLSWDLDESVDPRLPLEEERSGAVERQASWTAEADLGPASVYLLSWTDEGTLARAGMRGTSAAILGPDGALASDMQPSEAFDYVPGQDYRFAHTLLRAESPEAARVRLERTVNETAPETDARHGALAFALPLAPPA